MQGKLSFSCKETAIPFNLFFSIVNIEQQWPFTQLAPTLLLCVCVFQLYSVTATCEVTSVTTYRVGHCMYSTIVEYQVALPVDSPRVPLHCNSPQNVHLPFPQPSFLSSYFLKCFLLYKSSCIMPTILSLYYVLKIVLTHTSYRITQI